jgi:hypothetical protein
MLKTVRYAPSASLCYKGRNGVGRCIGVEVMASTPDLILITPISSKHTSGACWLQVPVSSVKELIALLQEAHETLEPPRK